MRKKAKKSCYNDGRIYVSHLAALKMMSSTGSGYSPAAIEGLKKADKNLKKVPKNRRDKKEEAVLEPKEASAVGTPETGLDRRGRRERLEKKKMDIWTLTNMRDKMMQRKSQEWTLRRDQVKRRKRRWRIGTRRRRRRVPLLRKTGAKKVILEEEENEMEENEEVTVTDKKQSSKPEKATHIEEVFGEEQDEVEEEKEQMEKTR